MTDAYTRIAKPTDSTYSTVNAPGREQYDNVGISYDGATFYDGVDPTAYTSIQKPTTSFYSFISKPTT